MVRKIEVVPYNPDWIRLFKLEAEAIKSILGKEIVSIHHVGSTSVPDMAAKPIIDLMVEVRNIKRIDLFNAVMIGKGYIPKGEFGIGGRRFFIKGTEEYRTHHIHMYATGHERLEAHIAFRDYLTAHPQMAAGYRVLKEELAKRYPTDADDYMAGKEALIRELNEKAREWKMRKG
jgi:GrpB-like predicted nucleotidyltransferase (UPF0157 family)